MVKNKYIKALALALAFTALLAGCSGNSVSYQSTLTDAASVDSSVQIIESTPAPEPAASEAAQTPTPIEAEEVEPSIVEEQLKAIGTEAEGDSIYKRRLTNHTEENVTGFFVKDQWMEDWPDNMIGTGDSWENGESRYLYFDASDSLERMADHEEQPVYSILLLFEGGDEAVLHDVALTDFEEAQVLESEGICYLTYRSLDTKEEVSTLSDEQARRTGSGGQSAESEEAAEESGSNSGSEEETTGDAADEEADEPETDEGAEGPEDADWNNDAEEDIEIEG